MKIKSTLLNLVNLKNSRGFILITSYLIISCLAIFSLALYARSTTFFQAIERNKNKMVAFNMSEAGMDLAIATLASNQSYTGAAYAALGNNGGYSVAVYSSTRCSDGSSPSSGTCGSVTVPTDPNVRMIVASGFAPSNVTTGRAYETRALTSYVSLGESSYFDYGVFAKDSVTLSGNAKIDSYNSGSGAYGGANVLHNGDVGTDGTGAGVVDLNGNAEIDGDAQIGPGGNTATGITTSGHGTVTGTKSTASTTQSYAAQSNNGTLLGSLSVNGNDTHTLPAGTYRYSSLSVSGNGKINATGPVTIYVDGSVSISGNGFSAQNNIPANFQIFVTTSDSVSISGNGDLYGTIYAPKSAISNTGNGEIYGAVIGKSYSQSGNGKVHYDEALKEIGGSSNNSVNMLSWRESNTSLS